ncbi:ROK family transcriptional regulator [Cellulosimicrobium marinum]|uniref:ROK family transcriptional regulator n=1 Tax=Cellulosimicrobium marinum TaxID=1638992 RepID=UPI001E358729|nr:ROK family transcriptional regulator [Cellulosimicrobium marinum]MCB7138233.1 ROK family transcriptional regulator [Cellulosimicrobium marinum]
MNRAAATRTAPPAARQATLREHNLALVARAVFEATTPCSRANIASASGLTRATVSTLVDRLVAARIVTELPPPTPQRAGRPAVPLVPAPRTLVGLGLEVNVDYLGARVVDLAGEVVAEHVAPDDLHDSDPATVLARLGRMARALVADVEADGMTTVGATLALPGLVDVRAARLEVAPNLGWSRLDPVPHLGLDGPAGPLPVGVANEAKLAALAQSGRGVVPDGDEVGTPSTYLYVSGDVGIGSAIVVDRRLFHGRHGWAGEIGHVVVDPEGPRCRCGARGCLEQYAGKDALLRAAGLDPAAGTDDLLAALDAGSDPARAAVARAGGALGSALADYVNLVDIDTVLLGGIYPPLLGHLRAPVVAQLRARVLAAPWSDLRVDAAPLDDHAALTGGAREVLRHVVENPTPWADQT